MNELFSNWSFLVINIYFISFIFYLKNNNRKLLKQNIFLDKEIFNNKKEHYILIREINEYHKNEKKEYIYALRNINYEYKFNKLLIIKLEKDLKIYMKSTKKYKDLYQLYDYTRTDLFDNNKKINHDMNKLKVSYKDVYEYNKQLINNNTKMKQDIYELNSDIFIYKSNFDSLNSKNFLLEESLSSHKIEILKLRNLLR